MTGALTGAFPPPADPSPRTPPLPPGPTTFSQPQDDFGETLAAPGPLDAKPVGIDAGPSSQRAPGAARSEEPAAVEQVESRIRAAVESSSDLPPPTGDRVVYAFRRDPWAERAEQQQAEGEVRRRRRRRVLQIVAIPAVVGLAAVAWFVVPLVAELFDTEADTDSPGAVAIELETPTQDVEGSDAAVDAPSASAPADADAPATEPPAADVDEVWLLDRGDGSYDWGVIAVSTATDGFNDVDLVATLLDVDGGVVYREDLVIELLSPGGRAAAGGVYRTIDTVPVRIEVTATVTGVDVADGSSVGYEVANLERVPSGQVNRDDRLVGSVTAVGSTPVTVAETVVRVVAIWRDGDGALVAAVVDELDAVSNGAALEFSVALPRSVVPAGLPDDIVVSLGS